MMTLFIKLVLLVNILTFSHASGSVGCAGGYEDLKWETRLCCEQTSATTKVEVCQLLNLTESSTRTLALGSCLDVQCWFGGQAIVSCNVNRLFTADLYNVKLEMLSNGTQNIVQCTGESSTCLISLYGVEENASFNLHITVNRTTPQSQEMQISMGYIRRPAPPNNLRYNVTTKGEVILSWNVSPDISTLTYEVRFSSSSLCEPWEVKEIRGHSSFPLNDLKSGVKYTVQVRCQDHFNLWSQWSQPLYVTLGVTYIPAEVFTIPGTPVTVYAVFHNHSWNASKAVWLLNTGVKIPDSQYIVVNERVSGVIIQPEEPGFDRLMCCHSLGEQRQCVIAYAKIYTEGLFNASIKCQSQNSKEDTMTCEWSKIEWATTRLLYRKFPSSCADMRETLDREDPESILCPDGAGDHQVCTLHGISLFSCYKIWLEVEREHRKVRSFPVYVFPNDYVKPSPPYDLEAVTLSNKTLTAKWTRPSLPVYDMQYEVRSTDLRGTTDVQWKVTGPLFKTQAEIEVHTACVQYKIAVRCRRLNGPGFWSDWSRSHISSVYSRKAPEMGPDFWRIIQEDPIRNLTNVTLTFKPVAAGDPESCVEGFRIVHQPSGATVWANETTVTPFYSFLWREDVHTITVMSRNALGISARNTNMMLLRRPKRRCVQSFRAVANASCVFLSWTLQSDEEVPQSFIIEWLDLNKDSTQDISLVRQLQWVRVSGSSRDCALCRRFYGTEEFILYPVFVDGEGEPARCTASKEEPAAYILLLIIVFLSVVLFVTLMVSQNQMKKLMWKDVPNPRNCSWAKGMEMRRIEAMENLFPHSEVLAACPLLLISESICEVEIIDKPLPIEYEHEKDNEAVLLHAAEVDKNMSESSEHLSQEASTAAATPETSGQSSVTYANILWSDQPGLLPKQQESLNDSSDEGNFSANNSDISGSIPGGLCDLENHACSDSTNPSRSNFYNSVEEFSETSDQDVDSPESAAKELYYFKSNEDEGEDEENSLPEGSEESTVNTEIMTKSCAESRKSTSTGSITVSHSVPLYLPQFKNQCKNTL